MTFWRNRRNDKLCHRTVVPSARRTRFPRAEAPQVAFGVSRPVDARPVGCVCWRLHDRPARSASPIGARERLARQGVREACQSLPHRRSSGGAELNHRALSPRRSSAHSAGLPEALLVSPGSKPNACPSQRAVAVGRIAQDHEQRRLTETGADDTEVGVGAAARFLARRK